MPKMKTHRGAAKRFKATGTGKLKRKKAYLSHILEHKSPKQKRNLGQSTLVAKADVKVQRKLLGL
jgi:large subunit ribosomal protein L35